MKLDGYSQLFAAKHPETGEIDPGITMTPEQAVTLGAVFSRKAYELSRKPELTRSEMVFIDRVVDLGSRCIIWGLEQENLPLPDLSETAELKRKADALSGHSMDKPVVETVKQSVIHSLGHVTGASLLLREPAKRPAAEDYAAIVMPFFAGMVRDNGGLDVNEYMAGNLKNLLAHYEMAESSAHRAGN